jgi:type IV pilus assembly protein PilV
MISKRHQAGATMIELMVALFVLAIGLLGALALQLDSVRSNQSAVFASEAQLLAVNMVDRILAYNNVLITTDDDDYDSIDTNSAVTMPTCMSAGCTVAQQKTYDIATWKNELVSRLPGGRGTVNYSGGVYTVLVMWDRDVTGASNVGCGGNPKVDLTCYQMEFRL